MWPDCSGRPHTSKDVARAYGVTKAAVDKAKREAGLTTEQPTRSLPWSGISYEHSNSMPARMLRELARVERGAPISEARAGELERWKARIEAAGEVVAYSRSRGFYYVKRRDGDTAYYRPPKESSKVVVDKVASPDRLLSLRKQEDRKARTERQRRSGEQIREA